MTHDRLRLSNIVTMLSALLVFDDNDVIIRMSINMALCHLRAKIEDQKTPINLRAACGGQAGSGKEPRTPHTNQSI